MGRIHHVTRSRCKDGNCNCDKIFGSDSAICQKFCRNGGDWIELKDEGDDWIKFKNGGDHRSNLSTNENATLERQRRCLCPPAFLGEKCQISICKHKRYGGTFCFPGSSLDTFQPYFVNCWPRNQTLTRRQLRQIRACPCFRGVRALDGSCRCLDGYSGSLCHLPPALSKHNHQDDSPISPSDWTFDSSRNFALGYAIGSALKPASPKNARGRSPRGEARSQAFYAYSAGNPASSTFSVFLFFFLFALSCLICCKMRPFYRRRPPLTTRNINQGSAVVELRPIGHPFLPIFAQRTASGVGGTRRGHQTDRFFERVNLTENPVFDNLARANNVEPPNTGAGPDGIDNGIRQPPSYEDVVKTPPPPYEEIVNAR